MASYVQEAVFQRGRTLEKGSGKCSQERGEFLKISLADLGFQQTSEVRAIQKLVGWFAIFAVGEIRRAVKTFLKAKEIA
jgi:hypothetical protein